MPNHQCIKDKSQFCFVCASYINPPSKGNRSIFNDLRQTQYKEVFNVKNIKNLNKWFVPNGICSTCLKSMRESTNKHTKFRFVRPAVWLTPKNAKSCYLCCTRKEPVKFNKKNFNWQPKLNIILPKHAEFATQTETKIEETDSDDSDAVSSSSDESEVDE